MSTPVNTSGGSSTTKWLIVTGVTVVLIVLGVGLSVLFSSNSTATPKSPGDAGVTSGRQRSGGGVTGSVGGGGTSGPVGPNLSASTVFCTDPTDPNCHLPSGKTGIDFGTGQSKIYDDGNLQVQSDDLIGVKLGTAKRNVAVFSDADGVYFPRRTGRNTHFDWNDDKNYIRGDTFVDDKLSVTGKIEAKGGIRTTCRTTYTVGQKQDPYVFDLDRHAADCGEDEYLRGWKMERNGDVVWYRMTCCKFT